MTTVPEPSRTQHAADRPAADREDRLPAARIGFVSGLVGILCCVGPAALALLGLMSGSTAFVLATDLYTDWGWWFRGAGLLVAGVLIWFALRRRDACDIDGVRRSWRSLVVIALVGVATYAVLYGVTTWLGTFAA